MNKYDYCKICGKFLSLGNFEICEECKKNQDLLIFLKKLIEFLGNKLYFVEEDLDKIGIDEFTGYEYIWELSKLNFVNLYEGKFFINKELITEFVNKYSDTFDKSVFNNVNTEHFEVYDPLKVKITINSDFYKVDILNLIENIVFVDENPKIPFPQSDDLNRFIFLGQHLLEKDMSKEEIKILNKVHPRIVNMYTSTGLYFSVFEKYRKDNQIFYKLSDKGKFIFSSEEYERNLNICKCILEHEIFYKVFINSYSKNFIDKNDIVDIMLQYDLNLGSMVTIKRRASCVSSWMHWIFNLMGI